MAKGENSSQTNGYVQSVTDEEGYSNGYTLNDQMCNPKEFGKRLKQARKKAGVSQSKLGDMIGVHENTICNYEAGQLPKGQHLVSFSRLLGVSIDWLLTGEEGEARKAEHTEEKGPKKGSESARPREKVAYSVDSGEKLTSDLLIKTAKILDSGTSYATALAANIHAFHQALSSAPGQGQSDRERNLIERMESLERELRELKEGKGRQESEEGKSQNEGDNQGDGFAWF